MTFYLCTIAKRKNAKRHIVGKYNTEAEAIKVARHLSHDRYIIQACSGDWTCIRHIN